MSTSYDVKLLRKTEVAEGTMEFTLEKPRGFEYRAGQYGDLVLPSSTGLRGWSRQCVRSCSRWVRMRTISRSRSLRDTEIPIYRN